MIADFSKVFNKRFITLRHFCSAFAVTVQVFTIQILVLLRSSCEKFSEAVVGLVVTSKPKSLKDLQALSLSIWFNLQPKVSK